MSKPCAVYILVEPERFKIGRSVSVVERAKLVTPDVNWEQSSAVLFDTVREAINCERTLHWLFRTQRLPAIRRDGGTEFFSLNCLPLVLAFISANRDTLGFQEIRSGAEMRRQAEAVKRELEQRAPRRPPETPEERELRRIRAEEAWKETNADCAARLFSILETLKDAEQLKGKFLFADKSAPDQPRTALVLVDDSKPSDVIHELLTYGQFGEGDWSRCQWRATRLFSSAEGFSAHEGWWIECVRLNDWSESWHSPVFIEALRECFASTFLLIEQLPYLPTATVEAIFDVFQGRAPNEAVLSLLPRRAL